MAALNHPLIIEQGADYVDEFPALNPAGQAQSIGGWTVRGQIRARPGSATVLHTLSLSALGDTVTLTIPAATSTAWAWTTGYYDVELVDPNSQVTRLVEGDVYVRPQTTR